MYLCHGVCARYAQRVDRVPGKHNGYQRIYERLWYCKGCSKWFDPKDTWRTFYCICCHRRLRSKPRGKHRSLYVNKTSVSGRPIRSLKEFTTS